MDRGIIYGLFDGTGLRYIGQTIQSTELRLKQHLWYSSKNKSYLGNWLRSLKNEPTLEVIEKCSYDNLNEREIKWIKEFQLLGCKLVNSMVGCDKSGHHTHSEETKRKIGEATIRTHTGMKRSKEAKERMSISAKNRPKRTLSEETILKIVESRKGYKTSEETKAKISKGNTGKKRSESFKKIFSKLKTKVIFMYDISSNKIRKTNSTELSELFNVRRQSINIRLNKDYGKIYRSKYYLAYSESQLKRILKQVGL